MLPDIDNDLDRKKRAAASLVLWKAAARHSLIRATFFNAVSGATIIAQAWLIASVLHATLMEKQPVATQIHLLLLFAALVVLRVIASYYAERSGFAAAKQVINAARSDMLARIHRAGPSALIESPTGQSVAAISEAARALEPYYSRYVPATAQALILPLGILVVIAPIDWLSLLVFAITAPLIPLFMILIGKGAEKLNQRQWLRLSRMSGHFLDAVQGMMTLQSFGATGRMAKTVAQQAEHYRRETMAVLRIAFLSSLTLEFFATVSIAMVAVFVGFRLLWGEIGFREGFFVLLLAPEFYLPLRAFGTAYHARMEALGAAERIVALNDMPQLALSTDPKPHRISAPFNIQFEAVSLTYPGNKSALNEIAFNIAPLQATALSGPSGSGKSSILSLVLGFIAPSKGHILVNGVDLAALDMANWRKQIAYVPQKAHLFSATLAQNIALGEAEPDLARVHHAIEQAALAELIAAMPKGLNTVIGDGGMPLSGGEAHRIALARAFYHDAALVLLDEPTAHIDQATERAIIRAIERLKIGRTLIVVAHRAATLALADQVITLESGRVVQKPAGGENG